MINVIPETDGKRLSMLLVIVSHAMVHAYVLIKTAPGESNAAIDVIRDMAAVAEAHIVAGEYDIVSEVEVEDVYTVLKTAASDIQALDGITETRTYIALE